MKLLKPTLWIALCSAAVVGVTALSQVERESPGAISLVHQRIPELQEAGCAACHGGWFSGMTDSCLECHEPIATQRDEGTGVHGTLPGGTAQPCALCHGDHHGEEFALVNEQSFALAGFEGIAGFDHERIGFAMAGAHLDLDCSQCHLQAEATVLPEGTQRYLGLRQDCASCHDDPHEGRMARGCAECHTQQGFDALQAPSHSLPLDGGHAELDCSACHGGEGPAAAHSLDAVGAAGPAAVERGRACQDCHETPHAAAFLWALAAAPLAEGAHGGRRACEECHRPGDGTFVAARATMDRGRHSVTGMDLDGPHQDVACADCHDPARPFAERFVGRQGRDCARCHPSPHGGQFGGNPEGVELLDELPAGLAVARGAGAACVDCHGTDHFAPHGFDAALHRERGIPLEGAHGRLECAACHGPDPAGVAQFRGIGRRCEQCHEDGHRGAFELHARELATVVDGTCAQCHEPTEFANVEGFDHRRWTGFAVAGSHLEAGCESCHPRTAAPDDRGRTLGFVAAHFGAEWEGCHSCHGDPHGETFARGGVTRCESCHDASSFRALPRPFDHGAATGFALRGAHGRADCSACHTPVSGAGLGERSAARAAGRACGQCHDDAHGGQFDPSASASASPQSECSRCHADGNGWDELVFVHDRNTRFELGDAHRNLACSACHKVETIAGADRTRFRPMDPSCTACHGVQNDPLRRRGGR